MLQTFTLINTIWYYQTNEHTVNCNENPTIPNLEQKVCLFNE